MGLGHVFEQLRSVHVLQPYFIRPEGLVHLLIIEVLLIPTCLSNHSSTASCETPWLPSAISALMTSAIARGLTRG